VRLPLVVAAVALVAYVARKDADDLLHLQKVTLP
jgi:hypothetical protein